MSRGRTDCEYAKKVRGSNLRPLGIQPIALPLSYQTRLYGNMSPGRPDCEYAKKDLLIPSGGERILGIYNDKKLYSIALAFYTYSALRKT